MAITYKVQRSTSGLSEAALNTLGEAHWSLLSVLVAGMGYQHVFYNSGSVVQYRSIYASRGLTVEQLQVQGDSDFYLVAVITLGVGTQYIFKRECGAGVVNAPDV